jgi:transposase-like protein
LTTASIAVAPHRKSMKALFPATPWQGRTPLSYRLRGADSKPVSAEQMEISRLRAELARVKMERDILKKATAYFAKESL